MHRSCHVVIQMLNVIFNISQYIDNVPGQDILKLLTSNYMN